MVFTPLLHFNVVCSLTLSGPKTKDAKSLTKLSTLGSNGGRLLQKVDGGDNLGEGGLSNRCRSSEKVGGGVPDVFKKSFHLLLRERFRYRSSYKRIHTECQIMTLNIRWCDWTKYL